MSASTPNLSNNASPSLAADSIAPPGSGPRRSAARLALIVWLIALAVYGCYLDFRWRDVAMRVCQNHLLMAQWAWEGWIRNGGSAQTAEPTLNDIVAYLPGQRPISCPYGVYSLDSTRGPICSYRDTLFDHVRSAPGTPLPLWPRLMESVWLPAGVYALFTFAFAFALVQAFPGLFLIARHLKNPSLRAELALVPSPYVAILQVARLTDRARPNRLLRHILYPSIFAVLFFAFLRALWVGISSSWRATLIITALTALVFILVIQRRITSEAFDQLRLWVARMLITNASRDSSTSRLTRMAFLIVLLLLPIAILMCWDHQLAVAVIMLRPLSAQPPRLIPHPAQRLLLLILAALLPWGLLLLNGVRNSIRRRLEQLEKEIDQRLHEPPKSVDGD